MLLLDFELLFKLELELLHHGALNLHVLLLHRHYLDVFLLKLNNIFQSLDLSLHLRLGLAEFILKRPCFNFELLLEVCFEFFLLNLELFIDVWLDEGVEVLLHLFLGDGLDSRILKRSWAGVLDCLHGINLLRLRCI